MTTHGSFLRVYCTEKARHGHRPLWEWLLELARELGAPGASAFRAVGGYGRHGRMHEQGFFELAGDLPMEVLVGGPDEVIEAFLARLGSEGLKLAWARQRVEFGVTGE